MLLYFLPDHPLTLSPAEIAAAGLAYAFDSPSLHRRQIPGAGPGGGPGVLFTAAGAGDSTRVGYYPERQQWRRVPKSPAWVGRYTDEAIAPDSLARPEQLQGELVRLADGQEWLVPVARAWVEEDGEARYVVRLPRLVEADELGRWRPTDVVPRHAPLWRAATAYFEALLGGRAEGDSVRIDYGDWLDAAVLALSANYRLGPAEASLLGLFDTTTGPAVLNVLTDLAGFLALKKKQASAGGNTSAGGAA